MSALRFRDLTKKHTLNLDIRKHLVKLALTKLKKISKQIWLQDKGNYDSYRLVLLCSTYRRTRITIRAYVNYRFLIRKSNT